MVVIRYKNKKDKWVSDKPENLGTDSLKQVDKDRIDLGHEQSGVHTGRIQRFLTENIQGDTGENSKKKKQERAMDMLTYMLINDPLYAAAFKRLENTLEQAYQAVDEALLSNEQRLAESVETAQKMEESAAKLVDGTAVFCDAHGKILTADGQILSAEDAQNINIPDGAPSWEEYKSARDETERLRREREEIERYRRDVLDDTRRRMYDRDDPIQTREELEKYERRVKESRPTELAKHFYEKGLEAELPVSKISAAQDIPDKPIMGMPPIAEQFASVNRGLPNLDAPPTSDNPTVAPALT